MSEEKVTGLTEEQMKSWQKLFDESSKKRRRIIPAKRNQLSLWLGRLIIEYNRLEHNLSHTLALELANLLGNEPPPETFQIANLPRSVKMAFKSGLSDIIMGTMPFKQKLDFLTALLMKRFANNPEHQGHINQIVKLLYAADEFRNKMIHSIWVESRITFSRLKHKTKGQKGLKVELESANIEQLRHAIEATEFLREVCLVIMTHDILAKQASIDYSLVGKLLRPMPSKTNSQSGQHP